MNSASNRAPGFRPARALAFLVGAHLWFTLLDATGKALAADMGAPLISLFRHAGQAALMLLVLAPSLGVRALLRTRHPGWQFLRGLSLTGFTLFFFTALRYLPQAEATAVNFIGPLIVMLLAGPLLGERVTWRRWVGAAVGFVGMLVIVRPGANLPAIGVGFVLLTVACNVVFQLLTRKLSTVDDSMATIFLSALTGCLLSLLLVPTQSLWGGWPEQVSTRQWLLLASMGVTGAISQWCLIRAYFWSSASFIAPLIYLQIVWATLSGWAFFSQWPAAISFVGMALVCAGGALTVLAEARSVQSRQRPRSSVDRASPS